jgi:hypothetical protein
MKERLAFEHCFPETYFKKNVILFGARGGIVG